MLFLPKKELDRRRAEYKREKERNKPTRTDPRASATQSSECDPAEAGKATWWRAQGYRAVMRDAFLSGVYRQRALVESVFSAVKRKLCRRELRVGASKTQRVQALLLGLSYSLYRLRPRLA